jgi:hypothetical protein
VSAGTYLSGDMTSLRADDNNYFVVRSTTFGTTRRTTTDFGFSNVATGSRADYSVRLKSSLWSTTVVISAFNYVSSTWTQLSSASIGTGEVTVTASLTASVSNYISSGGKMSVRVESSRGFTHSIYDEFINVVVTP